MVTEAVNDIRSCFDNGAHNVQVDFTEGRLAVKLDPSKQLLQQFIDLNNTVLSHFTDDERSESDFISAQVVIMIQPTVQMWIMGS